MTYEDKNDGAAEDWFSLPSGAFPAVPRPAQNPAGPDSFCAVRPPVSLPVLDSPVYRAAADVVDGALLILSQSPCAREFAAAAEAAGYRIAVSAPHHDGMLASADHAAKLVTLYGSAHDDPLRAALALAHELAHTMQATAGGLDPQVSALHPVASLRTLLALEADARAYEFLVAAELSFRTKDDPAERLVFPGLMAIAAETIGHSAIKKTVTAATPALQAGADPQQFMAAVFEGFYRSPSLRAIHENQVLVHIAALEDAKPGTLESPALFCGDLPQAELRERLSRYGRPYLADAKIDLEDSFMLSVSAETQDRLSALEALRRRNPDVVDKNPGEKPWRLPVYRLGPASAARPANAPDSKIRGPKTSGRPGPS
jgi:hypothetical protein